MKQNIIQEKSFNFALEIIDLYKHLLYRKKEYVLSKQILRSGTAIGAIVEEALGGQSQKDFLSKISMAYKEARETRYWLLLLQKSTFINNNLFSSLDSKLDEILKILGKIQITMKNRVNQ
jgi:four helix bundle protein